MILELTIYDDKQIPISIHFDSDFFSCHDVDYQIYILIMFFSCFHVHYQT